MEHLDQNLQTAFQANILKYPVIVLQWGSSNIWASDVDNRVRSRPPPPWTSTVLPNKVMWGIITHWHTCTHSDTHTHTHIHMRAHTHTYTHTHAHMHTHMDAHTHTHACTHAHPHGCTQVTLHYCINLQCVFPVLRSWWLTVVTSHDSTSRWLLVLKTIHFLMRGQDPDKLQ